MDTVIFAAMCVAFGVIVGTKVGLMMAQDDLRELSADLRAEREKVKALTQQLDAVHLGDYIWAKARAKWVGEVIENTFTLYYN